MLVELRIENLLLIERAELALDAGLNAITGETGAGKTMLAHAIDLLLGGKSRKGIVRPHASEAYVEGVFALPEGLIDRPEFADIRERLPDPAEPEIALARRVTPDGRTRAYIAGRSATAAELRELGGAMVSFFGQHEHRKLTLAGSQLANLDAFCRGRKDGGDHAALLAEASALSADARGLRRELTELEVLDGRRERELGLIEYELQEIETLDPDPSDFAELSAERARLKAVDDLRAAAEGALDALDDDESGGASALLASASSRLAAAEGADTELDEFAARVGALAIELNDVAAGLRSYGEGLSADPQRLAAVDERLDGYERLLRKHGSVVEDVLRHARQCREDRDRLADTQAGIALARERHAAVEARLREVAEALSALRRKAAPRLAKAVRERLAELALADASFEVEIATELDEIGPTGADSVEFLIAPNPGIAPTPLRETASGGELSRVMLALLTASGDAGERTYVFDEIDAGIGGHTARAVGERLRALSGERQVICITHLPQVAAAASRHFQIVKRSDTGDALTEVRRLDDDGVIEELCRMLGAGEDDDGARRHARELLRAVAA